MAISVKDLLEAGCHFGHQTKRWNPKMKDYVYGAKNGISIIDLTKTIRQIGDACNFLQREVMKGSRILFVGTKRQAQQVVRNAAEETEMFFMSERWMGGTLTNIETIRKSVKKMREIDDTTGGLKLIQVPSGESGELATVTSAELLSGTGKAIARSSTSTPKPYNIRFAAYETANFPAWFTSEPPVTPPNNNNANANT